MGHCLLLLTLLQMAAPGVLHVVERACNLLHVGRNIVLHAEPQLQRLLGSAGVGQKRGGVWGASAHVVVVLSSVLFQIELQMLP